MLVDTQLWLDALQDVRTRERAAKVRVADLATETRIRSEELMRNREARRAANETVLTVSESLEAAKDKALAEMGKTRDNINTLFGTVSLEELTRQLQHVQYETEEMMTTYIEPIRKSILAAARTQNERTRTVDELIQTLKDKIGFLRATEQAAKTQLVTVNDRLRAEEIKIISTMKSIINGGQEFLPAHEASELLSRLSNLTPPLSSDTAAFIQDASFALIDRVHFELGNASGVQATLEQNMAVNTELNVRIAAIQKSLSNIRELQSQLSRESAQPCTNHNTEECPTCGQELPPSMLAERATELTASLQSLTLDRRTAQESIQRLQAQLMRMNSMRGLVDSWSRLNERICELRTEAATSNHSASQRGNELSRFQRELESQLEERRDVVERLQQEDVKRTQELSSAEAEHKRLATKGAELQRKIEYVGEYIRADLLN